MIAPSGILFSAYSWLTSLLTNSLSTQTLSYFLTHIIKYIVPIPQSWWEARSRQIQVVVQTLFYSMWAQKWGYVTACLVKQIQIFLQTYSKSMYCTGTRHKIHPASELATACLTTKEQVLDFITVRHPCVFISVCFLLMSVCQKNASCVSRYVIELQNIARCHRFDRILSLSMFICIVTGSFSSTQFVSRQ